MADADSTDTAGNRDDDGDRSMQSLDDSMPSLVASSSESETDSDEEDYRQLEAQDESSRSEPVRVSPESRPPTATPTRAARVAGTAARVARWPEDNAPWRNHNSSDESLPDLVASSSSEGEETDEDERPRRNVRPRHSHTLNADWQRSATRSGTSRRPPSTADVPLGAPSTRATRPQWAGRGVGETWLEGPDTIAEPFPRAEPSLRANVRHSNYYSRWNSAAWQHPFGAAQAGQHGAGQPQVLGAFQVLDGGAVFGPFDQGDDIVIGEGDDLRGFRSLRPIDLLSSIFGSQGLRVDGASEAFVDGGDFDPLMQVLQASFNLPPQRKPQVCSEALDTVLLVRVSGDDTEIICPISAEVLKEGEWAARMPCGHYFGKEELFEKTWQWLRVNNSCPVCRCELPTDDAQYNQHKHLTLEQVSRAAVSACQAVDDVIGKRICSVREAVLQGMLEESCVHLSIEAPWKKLHDGAIAAVNRAALHRYYQLEQSDLASSSSGLGLAEEGRVLMGAAMLAHKQRPSEDHKPVASAATRRKSGTRRGQGLLFRPPGQSSKSVQVAIKEQQNAMVELYHKLQQGDRGGECDDPHADATQQRSQVRAQDSSVHDTRAAVAGIESGGFALEQSGDRVHGTRVFGKIGAVGRMEEDEESLFDEVLVQLLVTRQSELQDLSSRDAQTSEPGL